MTNWVTKEHLLDEYPGWRLTFDVRDNGDMELCLEDLAEQEETVIPLSRNAAARLLSKLNELVSAVDRLGAVEQEDE